MRLPPIRLDSLQRATPVLLALSLLFAGPVHGAALAPRGQEAGTSDPAAELEPEQPQPFADPLLLRLRSGDILFGEIAGHDGARLVFHRLDNDGIVRLPWELLDEQQSRELRLLYGYLELESEEILVRAEAIPLRNGSELIGLIVNRTEEHIYVKTAQQVLPLPKTRVAGPARTVMVPAQEIYTREELYKRKAEELAGPIGIGGVEAAQAHFELAEYCERILDYAHAAEHYELALEQKPDFQGAVLAAALGRAQIKAGLQDQVDYLAEADRTRARKRFGDALARLEEFPALYPDSALLEDWSRLRERTLKGQERALRERVVSRWHHWTARHAREAARLETFEEVMAYLEAPMGTDVLASVHADMLGIAPEITPEQVRAFWDAREAGRAKKASYGLGTWLIGDAAARAGLASEEKEAPGQGEKATERQRLEQKWKRYLQNQRVARSARQQGDAGEDANEFWGRFPFAGRSQWILAYYAERSGDMRVTRINPQSCRTCGGTGIREVVHTGSSITGASGASAHAVVCPTCHHIGIVRRISYR